MKQISESHTAESWRVPSSMCAHRRMDEFHYLFIPKQNMYQANASLSVLYTRVIMTTLAYTWSQTGEHIFNKKDTVFFKQIL